MKILKNLKRMTVILLTAVICLNACVAPVFAAETTVNANSAAYYEDFEDETVVSINNFKETKSSLYFR